MLPDQVMPESIEAERTILGSILLDKTALEQTRTLRTDDFYLDAHKRIFSAMAMLEEEKQGIDLVTLSEQLRRNRDLDAVSGVTYLASLTDQLPRRPSIANYVRIVQEKAALRAIILASHNTLMQASEPDANPDTISSEFKATLAKITENYNASGMDGIYDIGHYAGEHARQIEALRASEGELVGLTYGVHCLDDATTGMRPGENTVVGGRPGAGKSSFALTSAIANAKKGVRVYYRSDEMTGNTVFGRTLSNLASVNNFLLRNPKKLNPSDLQFLRAASDEAATLPLIIDEKPCLHIDHILTRARHLIRTRKVELCIFDYLQIIRSDGRELKDKVGNAAEAIALFAREMNVHCMMLSQLSRPDKKLKAHPPTLSDLRESGRIEDNADVVILLHRADKDDEPDNAIIAKQRNGPLGTEDVIFEKATLTYRDK